MLKAVLDTQVILRGASSPPPSVASKIYAAWDAGGFTLLISEPILSEVQDVLSRPEVLRKLRMTHIEAGALFDLLRMTSSSSAASPQGLTTLAAPTPTS